MRLKEMYKKLNELGCFTTEYNQLNEKQADFLEDNNNYDINPNELLEIINAFSTSDYAQIDGIYDNIIDLARNEIENTVNLPYYLEWYFNYEEFGKDLLSNESYIKLEDERVVYIGL